jgi:hypothetical protein
MHLRRTLIASLVLAAFICFAERPAPPKLSHEQRIMDMQNYHGAGLRRRMWRFEIQGKETLPKPEELKAHALWWYENAAPDFYDEITIFYHLEGLPWQNGAYAGYTFRKGKGLDAEFVRQDMLWLRDNWDSLD